MIDKNKLQQIREETKKEILEKLKTSNKFAVVRPFGFGKTYTILELCKELKGRKIILEPNLEIIKNIKNNIFNNTQCITYNSLLHKDFNPKELLGYDYIFLDEIHRTLAPKWGEVLTNILQDFQGKVIGFTATPIRGDGRKPIDEIFNGEQISKLSLIDAIVQEILPNPTYVTGIYELNQIIINNKQLRVQLKNYNLQNSLNEMFNKYLDLTKPLKIMAFSYTISDINQTKKYLEEWLNVPINHYYYHSYQSNEQNEIELTKFKNANSGINIIHSINQLNEGFHFDDLNALIFFRKTNSDVVYLQQLGRGISENLNNIVVFDLMNNFLRNTNGYCKLIKEYADENNIEIKNIRTISNEPLKIYCEQQDLIDLLKKHSDKHMPLNEEEKEFILNNYKKMSCNQMAKILNRSLNPIMKFLDNNNLPRIKTNFLTDEEKKYILKNYENMSYTQIGKNIGRRADSVREFLKREGVYKNKGCRLTEIEKQYIQENRLKISPTLISKNLKRDKATVINYLRKNDLKYLELGGKPLNKKEKEYIRKNHKKISVTKMKKILKRDRETIVRFLKRNNLEYNYKSPPKLLTEEEIKFIIENSEKMTLTNLCKKINRGPDTVRKVLKKHGIYKSPKCYEFTDEQKLFIRENHKYMTCSAIGKTIGTTEGVVIRYLERNNLERFYSERERKKRC